MHSHPLAAGYVLVLPAPGGSISLRTVVHRSARRGLWQNCDADSREGWASSGTEAGVRLAGIAFSAIRFGLPLQPQAPGARHNGVHGT